MVIGATAVVLVAAALARPAERTLPAVVTVGGDSTQLRGASRTDIGFLAALHLQTLPHTFFASLGHGFLRAYHRTFVTSPHAHAQVAVVGDIPVGMLLGILDVRAHRRWVLKHSGARLAIHGIIGLLWHPRANWRFVRTRLNRYRRAWRDGRAAPADRADPGTTDPPAVLSHVAVLPGAHGAGVGSILVDAFIEVARERGAHRIVLVTLAGTAGAAAFYHRLGWKPGAASVSQGTPPMVSFTLDLDVPTG